MPPDQAEESNDGDGARQREVCDPPLIPYNVLRLNYVLVLIIGSGLKLVLAHVCVCLVWIPLF